MSNVFSSFKDQVAKSLLGELIVDIGAVAIDDYGTELRLSIRQFPGQDPFLDINRKNYTDSDHYSATDLKACADYFERAAREMRKYLTIPATAVDEQKEPLHGE